MGKIYGSMRMAAVVSVAAAIVFGGCSSASTDKANQTPSASATSGASSATPLEIADLQVFSVVTNFSGAVQGWWADVLKEKAGVKLDIMPSGDQGAQKLQALMASGELPDIVVFKDPKQLEDAVKANLLVNLDEHMDKLPNVAEYAATALQFYRDTVSNGTGNAYAVPSSVGPAEESNELNYGPYLRWDLYKRLGMPELNAMEDYLPLLKQMQELEPQTADGQKVYGITLWKDWDGNSLRLANVPFHGIDTGDNIPATLPFMQLDVASGELRSNLEPDSEYLRFLKFYYQANQMGILDPDSLSQTFNTAFEKIQQGRVLFAWWPWFASGYNTAERDSLDPPQGFRPVFTKESKPLKYGDNTLGEPWAMAIGKSTRNLDAALRYLDFMYSIEGNQLLFSGPQGVIWDTNDQGEPYVTDQGWDIITNNKDLPGGGKLPEAVSFVSGLGGLSRAVINPQTKLTVDYQYWPTTLAHSPTKLVQDWQSTTGFKSTLEMLKSKNMYATTTTAMKLIPLLSDDLSAVVSKIGDTVKTYSWLAVFAKSDAEFQNYIDEMRTKAEGLGLQQVVEANHANWKTAQESADKYAR